MTDADEKPDLDLEGHSTSQGPADTRLSSIERVVSSSRRSSISPGRGPGEDTKTRTSRAEHQQTSSGGLPASTEARPLGPILSSGRSIRDILIASKIIGQHDAEMADHYQLTHSCDFGEAAERLELISKDQHLHALAQRFGYGYLSPSDPSLSDELDIAYRPMSPHAESLRSLRTDLLTSCGSEKLLIAVISPDRYDGRSRLVSNLALAFGQLNRPTLLVDADLRSPRLHTLFRVSNEGGLSSILSGASYEESIHRVKHFPALTVIPAGPLAPNPQELLSSRMFSALLDAARIKYDIVLADTSASSLCADWELVAKGMGRAILVTRRDQTRRPDLEKLIRRMSELDIKAEASLFLI